jgi:hypothetical protein
MKRHSGKHKVLRALAAASGLGQLGARSGKVREFYAPKIRINTKDLLKDPRKLAYLAVMNTAAELAASGGVSDNLTGAERSYIERSVSAFVANKAAPSKPDSVGLEVKADGGQLFLIAGDKRVKLAARQGNTALEVCPHELATAGKSGKAIAANHFASRVMFSLLGTGMGFKTRKVTAFKNGEYVKQYRYFVGPSGMSEPRVDSDPDRCYRVEVSKELQARALENFAMNKMSEEYRDVSAGLQDLVSKLSYSKRYGVLPESFEYASDEVVAAPASTEAMAGLGQMEYSDGDLSGVRRRRRRKSSKRRVAKKAPSRRRSVRRKKK